MATAPLTSSVMAAQPSRSPAGNDRLSSGGRGLLAFLFGLGDLAKGFRVDDVGEFVESPEQKLIVPEVAEFVDDLCELTFDSLERIPAFGRNFDAHPATVDFVGDSSEPSFLFQAGHDGGERGSFDGSARGQFARPFGPASQKEEQPVLGKADAGIAADLLENSTHDGHGSNRSRQPDVGILFRGCGVFGGGRSHDVRLSEAYGTGGL